MSSTRDSADAELAALKAEVAQMRELLALTSKRTETLKLDSMRLNISESLEKFSATWDEAKRVSLLPPKECVAVLVKSDTTFQKRVFGMWTGDTAMDHFGEIMEASSKDEWNRLSAHLPSNLLPTSKFSLILKAWRATPVKRVKVTLSDDSQAIETPVVRGIRRSEDVPAFRLCGVKNRSGALGASFRILPAAMFNRLLEVDTVLADYVTSGVVVVMPLSDVESRQLTQSEILGNWDKRADLAQRGWQKGEAQYATDGTTFAEEHGLGDFDSYAKAMAVVKK